MRRVLVTEGKAAPRRDRDADLARRVVAIGRDMWARGREGDGEFSETPANTGHGLARFAAALLTLRAASAG